MEEPEYQSLLTEAGMSGQGLPTAAGIVIGAKAKNFPKALAETVSYTHLTLPTNREV